MPYNTPDASAYIAMKRLTTQSEGSVNISPIKLRAPLVYRSYLPTYKTHIVRRGLESNKGDNPIDEIYAQYIQLRESGEVFDQTPNARVLFLSILDENIPLISPYEQSFFTNSLIKLAKNLTPDVNSTKLTSGESLRNVKLCEEAYKAPGSRSTTVDDVTYVPELSNTNNYAIYKNTTTSTVIISFRGTDVYRDVLTDLSLTAGFTTDQRFVNSVSIYDTVRNHPDFNGWTIETTGHSLGGCLGLYLNYLYGIKADVFDPAVGKGMFLNNPNGANATAHIVKGDIVSPLVAFNRAANTIKVYEVEDKNYGYYGYHLRSNFYTPTA